MTNKDSWTYQLDWLNVISILGLKSINQIPKNKKEKAIDRLTKSYGSEMLLNLEPKELDELLAEELKELMKKELALNQKRQEKINKRIKAKMIPFKKGGIIPINLNDLKDFDPNMDPKELLKYFFKKLPHDEDDEKDDDRDKYDEDKSFYYI